MVFPADSGACSKEMTRVVSRECLKPQMKRLLSGSWSIEEKLSPSHPQWFLSVCYRRKKVRAGG